MNWIDPVLIKIGPIAIHWYGLMYAFGFISAYLFLQYSKIGKKLPLTDNEKDNILIWLILGVLLGGRIGYILFYNLPYYLQNPLSIFKVWEGGMSFHGGLIGVALATFLANKKYKIDFLSLSDVLVLIAPIGIFFGRIGNFINGELYGRIATNFCFHFPTDPAHCRYPSQLFEAIFEGLVLFVILYLTYLAQLKKAHAKPDAEQKYTQSGFLTALFLILYGVFRVIIEFFREPDVQIGYLFGLFTEGQLLSFLMIIGGIMLLIYRKKLRKI